MREQRIEVLLYEQRRLLDAAFDDFIEALTAVAGGQMEHLVRDVRRALRSGELKQLENLAFSLRGRYSRTIRDALVQFMSQAKRIAAAEVGVTPGAPSTAARAEVAVKAGQIADLHAARWQAQTVLDVLNARGAGLTIPAAVAAATEALAERAQRDIQATANIVVNDAINEGRNEGLQAGDIQGYQYSAILDDRTCALCEDLDGMTLVRGDARFDEFNPPIHDRCRCVWIGVLSDEVDFRPEWRDPSADMIAAHGSLIVERN